MYFYLVTSLYCSVGSVVSMKPKHCCCDDDQPVIREPFCYAAILLLQFVILLLRFNTHLLIKCCPSIHSFHRFAASFAQVERERVCAVHCEERDCISQQPEVTLHPLAVAAYNLASRKENTVITEVTISRIHRRRCFGSASILFGPPFLMSSGESLLFGSSLGGKEDVFAGVQTHLDGCEAVTAGPFKH